MGAFLWLVADGLGGRITWVVDFFATGYPPYRAWRPLLPDYLQMRWWTWALHAGWLLALGGWGALAWRRARQAPPSHAEAAVQAGQGRRPLHKLPADTS